MANNRENGNKKRAGILIVMLVLILAIGATAGISLAKYISSVTVETKTATVAKWGYTITADANNLFGESYGEVGTTKLAKVSGTNTVVVKGSSTSGAIVAPGTTGYMTLKLQGTSEVNALLTIDVTDFETIALANSDGKGNAYKPIDWTVNQTAVTSGSAKSDLAAAIAGAIQSKVQAGSISAPAGKKVTATASGSKVTVELPANTRFGTNGLELKISWTWAFSKGSENDRLDTILGQIADNKGATGNVLGIYAGTVYEVSVGLEATFVQTQDTYAR